MKHSIVKRYAVLLVLVGLTSACSVPAENSGDANANASQQANSTSDQQRQVAQSGTPVTPPAPLTVQPIPPPVPALPEKSGGAGNANSAKVPATTSERAPKLVAPAKKIDYGKQPQDKTLIRTIAIRNGGQANLNIESVTPS